ncbi:hypothetical protein F0U59_40135 [Archangium gephyra]|nr:hypothetical protein F0U59_40135 [Archangium gephyra]
MTSPATPGQAASLARPPAAAPVQRLQFRFRLFPLGLITGMFDPQLLVELIREGCESGHRLIRREFTLEPRRVLLILQALSFGLVFRRDAQKPEPEHDYRVAIYKTRFFTKTVNTEDLARVLNQTAEGGFELYHALKYPTRFLFFFPRESYIFIFRRPFAGQPRQTNYIVHQTPYRFFSRTMDPQVYESDLNTLGRTGQIKITFRDERRVLGLFRQPTAVAIFEQGA